MFAGVVGLVLIGCLGVRAEAAPIELFVDHYAIDRMDGASLRLHEPVGRESVLAFDRPWEGVHVGYVTILQDGDLYRLYYRGLPKSGRDGSDDETTCCAESKDGITFTRPSLGLFEVNGSKDNNVILAGMAPFSHNFAPFLDPAPGVDPALRYKALAGPAESGLVAFSPPGGLRWAKMREQAVITKGAFDSQNVAFWSESEQCYVAYVRTWTETNYGGFRSISRATSTDFLTWTDPVQMTFGDTPLEHLYTNQTRPYYRKPDLYVSLAARFMPGRGVITDEQAKAIGNAAGYSGDCSDTVLMTSRGGTVYDRTFMEGFVRPGYGAGNWTSRTNYCGSGIVPTSESEMSFYVQRHYGQPTHFLQRMVLRIDGFVSVNAPYAGGEMVTKPLWSGLTKLAVNFATSAAGGIKVEIQDEAGNPVPGFTLADSDELVGDEISRVVTWKGQADLSKIPGKIRFRFAIKDADLYSIQG